MGRKDGQKDGQRDDGLAGKGGEMERQVQNKKLKENHIREESFQNKTQSQMIIK